jgi:uncharacterized Zn finger protein
MSHTRVITCDDGSYIVSFTHKGFSGAYTIAKGDESELPENSGEIKRVDAHKGDRKEYTKAAKVKGISTIYGKDIDKLGKVARATVNAVNSSISNNPYQVGDKVLYDGKPFTVARAYMYKDKPYCILSDKRQVSAGKLIKSK